MSVCSMLAQVASRPNGSIRPQSDMLFSGLSCTVQTSIEQDLLLSYIIHQDACPAEAGSTCSVHCTYSTLSPDAILTHTGSYLMSPDSTSACQSNLLQSWLCNFGVDCHLRSAMSQSCDVSCIALSLSSCNENTQVAFARGDTVPRCLDTEGVRHAYKQISANARTLLLSVYPFVAPALHLQLVLQHHAHIYDW